MSAAALAEVRRPAVFLDRDGTLTWEVGYVNHASRLQLLPGVGAAIARLNAAGVLAVVTTNQAGVARGYFEEPLISVVHDRLRELVAEDARRTNADGPAPHFDAIYYCPHHPREGAAPYREACQCRKPRPGMIEQAARELPCDLAASYMIGDKVSDSEFGHRLGLRTCMVLTGYGRGEYEYQRHTWTDTPDHLAEGLLPAVEWVLTDLGQRGLLPAPEHAPLPAGLFRQAGTMPLYTLAPAVAAAGADAAAHDRNLNE